MTRDELKAVIKECVNDILNEDLSDISKKYERDIHYDQFQTRDSGKRPKITKDMSDYDKKWLYSHDHGDRAARSITPFQSKSIYDYANKLNKNAEDDYRSGNEWNNNRRKEALNK